MLSSVPFQVPQYLLSLCNNTTPIQTAVVAANHMIVLESVYSAVKENLITPVLVGNKAEIKKMSRQINWDLKKVRIIHSSSETNAAATCVSLAKNNEVAAMMKGQIHTDTLMAAVLSKKNGLQIDRRLSHVFHMTVPKNDQVLMITDGAVNIAPNQHVKIDIIKNVIELAHALGNKNPRVAILSGTETPITSMPSSIEAAEVVQLIKKNITMNAYIEGPLAFDNAISPRAAQLKGLSSPVAGKADILVVPNIETGNSLFKMMVYFMSAVAAGIVLGAKVPIMLTSRSDPPEARIASAALAAIMANKTL